MLKLSEMIPTASKISGGSIRRHHGIWPFVSVALPADADHLVVRFALLVGNPHPLFAEDFASTACFSQTGDSDWSVSTYWS
jgi:hypothetical protein